jgi:hypothetical protein
MVLRLPLIRIFEFSLMKCNSLTSVMITLPTIKFLIRYECKIILQVKQAAKITKLISKILLGAGNGIRTHEHLRDWTLNPAPLTWLGNPRKRCRHPDAVVVFNIIC